MCRSAKYFLSLSLLIPTALTPHQVLIAVSPSPPTPPTGHGGSLRRRQGWPGRPTRLWWSRALCGSSAATSSTPLTITWSKRECLPRHIDKLSSTPVCSRFRQPFFFFVCLRHLAAGGHVPFLPPPAPCSPPPPWFQSCLLSLNFDFERDSSGFFPVRVCGTQKRNSKQMLLPVVNRGTVHIRCFPFANNFFFS